jgi:hypothetical protein
MLNCCGFRLGLNEESGRTQCARLHWLDDEEGDLENKDLPEVLGELHRDTHRVLCSAQTERRRTMTKNDRMAPSLDPIDERRHPFPPLHGFDDENAFKKGDTALSLSPFSNYSILFNPSSELPSANEMRPEQDQHYYCVLFYNPPAEAIELATRTFRSSFGYAGTNDEWLGDCWRGTVVDCTCSQDRRWNDRRRNSLRCFCLCLS